MFKIKLIKDERDHTFTCGTKGSVVDKINIEINFDKINMQTHKDFYTELGRIIKDHIEGEVEGYLDNC